MNFDVAGLLGGIIHEDRKPGGADYTKEDAAKKLGVGIKGNAHLGFLGDEFERKTVKSLCFPLYSILLALGNPTVHYFRYKRGKTNLRCVSPKCLTSLSFAVWMLKDQNSPF